MAVVTLGISVGKWIDDTHRLKAVQISLGVRNGSVMAAALALEFLLQYPSFASERHTIFICLVVLVNLFGGLSAIATLATNIAIERDWVLAVASGKRIATLEELNSGLRSIDLTCKLLAPILVGIIMNCVSVSAATVLLAIWNIVSIGFEYVLLKTVYDQSWELQRKKNVFGEGTFPIDCYKEFTESDALSENNVENTHGFSQNSTLLMKKCIFGWISNVYQKVSQLHYIEGCKVYVRQKMLLAALALSMLYFTVLSFGSLMTAYLNWRGIPAYTLSLTRGLAALIGICGALSYPKVHAHLHTLRTGLWSIVIQWGFLSLCVASCWVPNSVASSILLISGVCLSRFALWMFDLSVLQLIQESLTEDEQGIVGGVQNSVQSFMEMMCFCVGILISNPKDFDILVYLSYGAVTSALVLYIIQVYRIRGHIFQLGYHLHPYQAVNCDLS